MSEIALLGDIAFNGIISSSPDNNKIRFSQISRRLRTIDTVFANLEAPVFGHREFNENKRKIHFADKEVTRDILQSLNIGCVSMANNHIYDCKMGGLKATIDLLDELGISHTGAGWRKEHIEPVIIEKNGTRFGFLAYVDKSTNPKTEHFPELLINYIEIEKIISDIKDLRNSVDKIICSLHWGQDYSNYFTIKQQDLARILITEGVDAIMGHHPHTIQPYEVFDGKYIFYSLGQLCFGDSIWEGDLRALKRKTKLGIITILNSDGGLKNIIPTKELKGNYIEISNIHIISKLNRLWNINNLILKHRTLRYVINIKESFIDRIIEFCFGYYRNPFKEILKFKNYRKIAYLVRDYRARR